MNQNEPSGKITFSGIANPEGSELPWMFDIFTIDANGQNIQQLTFGDEWLCNPALSPDGKKIAFTQHIENEDDPYGYMTPTELACYVMNSDGTGKRLLMEMRLGYGTTLCFSPDSKQILFSHDGHYIIDVDGSNMKQITTEGGVYNASFTTDGASIIYVRTGVTKEASSGEDDYETIGFFKMNVDGNNQKLLYPFSLLDRSWQNWVISPDCSKIAYETYTKINCQVDKSAIYILDLTSDLNDSNPKKVTEGFDNVGCPAFSPDGSHLAFIEHNLSKSRAYTIKVDGSDLRPLTNGIAPAAAEFSPFAWVK